MLKAAIVFMHNKPEQVNMFIKQLIHDGDTDVFVHVDKKYDNLKDEIINHEKVIILKNNIEVEWGSDSLLKAQLIACREIITRNRYKYIISCSGADLMIRNGLNVFLETHNGEVFIDSYEQDSIRRIYLLRKWPENMRKLRDNLYDPIRVMRRFRIELFKHGFPFYKKNILFNTESIKFYRCFCWFAMPIEVIIYILNYIDNNPSFMDIFDGGLVAEEGFWATIIMHSPYKYRISYNNGVAKSLTYVRKFFRNNHPPVLTIDDIDELEKSKMFFARKFDLNVDKSVIEYFYNKVVNSKNSSQNNI